MIFRFDVTAQYKAQFDMADADQNGYLDKQEADRSPLFRGVFAAMDRDGDGKLYMKEVTAYLNQVERFRQMAAQGCVSLAVHDEGKGIFDHLDADGDGRLSVRELRNAAKVLMKLDADEDGKLSLAELPRHYRGSFGTGPTGGGQQAALAFVADLDGGMMGRPALPERTRGPLWFRKMDRNRDGDVSRREWLGTRQAFDAIDTDGDGLISVEEAEAYDRAWRAKKE
jgi:Ca2+-binding EF-hand superfamily protein